MWKVTGKSDDSWVYLPKLFGTWEDAQEAIEEAKVESPEVTRWEAKQVESYADDDEPPMCWHVAGQDLVNALWMEVAMTSATLKAAESRIRARVAEALGAEVLGVDLVERLDSWQGTEGYSIRFDFVVWWSKPSNWSEGGQEYGTHQGVVHSIYGKEDVADMFWGHYALTKDEAFTDYVERSDKLTRRKA